MTAWLRDDGSVNQDEFSPRRIETVDDVVAVLGSPAASFVELLECVMIAGAVGDWRLRHLAAERAFDEVRVDTANARPNMEAAARIVVDNYLKAADSLEDLSYLVEDAEHWVESNRWKFDSARLSEFAEESIQLLAELQLLLSDPEPEAKVRLCSRLRKVDRADLGIEAVRPVANEQRDNVPALTTLGAAYCDVNELEKAERVLRAALAIRPRDTRARIALSRVFQEAGRLYEALDEAGVAFAEDANAYTSHRLLAAASAVGDADAFDQALEEVERAAEASESGPPDVYLLILAAEALKDQGRTDDLAAVLERIAGSGLALRGAVAKRFSELKQAARLARSPTLFAEWSE